MLGPQHYKVLVDFLEISFNLNFPVGLILEFGAYSLNILAIGVLIFRCLNKSKYLGKL